MFGVVENGDGEEKRSHKFVPTHLYNKFNNNKEERK